MADPPTHHVVTEDALTRHRLEELEKMAVGWREAERRVDALGLSIAAVEKTTTEIQVEMRERDEHTRGSLARLHARLDVITTAEAREAGRDEGKTAGRVETLKLVGFTVMATIGASGVVVALLALVLKH